MKSFLKTPTAFFSVSAFVATIALLCFSLQARAYPEYATRYNIMSCTACHVSPSGGGPRTLNGKLFSAHGFKMNPFLVQPYVSADFRTIFYDPQNVKQSSDGMGVMSGSIAANLPVDASHRIHLVVNQNVAGFSIAPTRSAYALFELSPNDGRPHMFDDLMVGRIRPAFGIVTDEHRTYTHIQTGTMWYEFDTGAQLSGTPTPHIHYDLALVNGTTSPTAGTTFGQDQAQQFGGFFNIRYMPTWVMIGASGEYWPAAAGQASQQALTLYSIASIGRATWNRIPVDIKLEFDEARNEDSNLTTSGFISQTYVTALGAAQSQGAMAWVDYNVNNRLTLIYKYDYLVPDVDYGGDYFDRNGIGFRWFIGPGVDIQARTELAHVTATNSAVQNDKTDWGTQNATFAFLQIEI